MAKRTMREALNAIEEASPLNSLAKANKNLTDMLAKGGNFLSDGPVSTKADQSQDFMGGGDKMKLAEDERAGEDEDEDGEEGAEGRIKRSTNKGKNPKDPGGASPGDSPAMLRSAASQLRDLQKGRMKKAFPPSQDDDDDSDSDGGPADSDDGSDGDPSMAPGGAPPPAAMPPQGDPNAMGPGDPSQNPQAQAIIQALQQDPSLIEVLINYIEQNMAPDQSQQQPGMPPPAAPAGPPAGAPQMMRSMNDHQNDLTQRLAKSDGANELIQAVEASPAMEALTSQMIQYEAQSRAQFDQMSQLLRSLAAENQGLKKSLNGLLGGVATLLESQASMQKSLGAAELAPMQKSNVVNAIPSQQPFNPGVQWTAPGQQQAGLNKSRNVDLNINALQKSLEEHAQKGDKQAAVLMGGISSDPHRVAQLVSQDIWDTYEKLAPSFH
jgi:hypothetical protein